MDNKKRFRRIVIAVSAVASLSLCACMYGPAPYDGTAYTHNDHIPGITDNNDNAETDDTPVADTLTESHPDNE